RRSATNVRDARGARESSPGLGRHRRIAADDGHARAAGDVDRNCARGHRRSDCGAELIMKKRLVLIGSLAVAGLLLFGNGMLLYAKAQLAQVLLERAWARTLQGEQDVKPWRWADTCPIARLQFPRQRRRYIVLAGASRP